MIPYLLHIAILITGGYIFYKLFLEKETFFRINRWILLAGVLIVVALPFLQIPVEWSLRNQVKSKSRIEAPAPVKYYAKDTGAESMELPFEKISPAKKETAPQATRYTETTITTEVPEPEKSNLSTIFIRIYFVGLAVFAVNFLTQFCLLIYQIISRPKIKEGTFRIIKIKRNSAPFSFWNWIFINPSEYDRQTYLQILEHEQIHVLEKHSLDIMLAELLVIIQWFNPFAWLYRKAVENNLEYLTDQKMLVRGTDRQAYQMSLLRIAVPDLSLQLTTNYNQSFLKKRISMMNARKSSLSSAWKYLFLIPLLALSVLCLNAVKTKASETSFQAIPGSIEQSEPEIPESEEPESEKAFEYEEEPEEEMEAEATPEESEEPELEEEPEEEMELKYDKLEMSGKWFGSIKGDKVCLTFNSGKSKNHYWHSPDCIDKNAFSSLPVGSEGTFELKNDAGTIRFTGKFTGNDGMGTYSFTENTAFRSYLEQQGITDIHEHLLFHCVISGIDKAYLAEMKRTGFEVNDDNLELLAHIGPEVNELKKLNQDLKAIGYPDADLDELLSLTIHEVDTDYIKALKAVGYTDLELEEVVQASIHDISPEYFEKLKAAGVSDLEFEELLQFAIHDIDTEMIKKFEGMGFDLSEEEMIQFAIHEIDPAKIEQFKSMGFKDLSTEEILHAAIHDVTPEYLNELKSAGISDLSMEEIVHFAIHDVDAEMVREFRSLGFDLSNEEMIHFAIHDVDAEDTKEFASLGFRDLSAEDMVHASIHDVDAAFIRSIHDLGLKDVSMEELVLARIHDVDAAYIKSQQAKGKQGLSLEEYIHLKIRSHHREHHDDER